MTANTEIHSLLQDLAALRADQPLGPVMVERIKLAREGDADTISLMRRALSRTEQRTADDCRDRFSLKHESGTTSTELEPDDGKNDESHREHDNEGSDSGEVRRRAALLTSSDQCGERRVRDAVSEENLAAPAAREMEPRAAALDTAARVRDEANVVSLPFTKHEHEAFAAICFTAMRTAKEFVPARTRLSFDDLRTMSKALADLMSSWQAERSARKAHIAQVYNTTHHPDDIAVDSFAAAMKAKLAKKRDDGRSGWDNPDECTVEFLAELLVRHVRKGDPVDIGNLAMMLFHRNGGAALASIPTPTGRAEALEALAPFAKLGRAIDDPRSPDVKRGKLAKDESIFAGQALYSDDGSVEHNPITFGDLRRAVRALSSAPAQAVTVDDAKIKQIALKIAREDWSHGWWPTEEDIARGDEHDQAWIRNTVIPNNEAQLCQPIRRRTHPAQRREDDMSKCWTGTLTRIQAIKIIDRATDKDDPYWEHLVGDYYSEHDDTMPTIMDVLATLGVTQAEYREASGADGEIDWPTRPASQRTEEEKR